ncbi:techylectin-5A-like isoform X1 [Argiope bruennichi]|uniref:techylectin-5A-like isoform X1 n=1 Tax=Argiope bruennichi TaxID=94029 RepID=UPI0024955E56|nr:techylectin-5A-like isoform X1 [Argiope bruennichi]
MKNIYLFCACFLNFLAILSASGNAKCGCLEKEKALALLETAENFLTKARDAYPSCKKSLNSTNQCEGEKSLAYFEISRKLISDVRENFPTCCNPIIDDDETEIKDDKQDKTLDENLGDCSEILASGHNKSGVYKIWLGKNFPTGRALLVYCDMETDGGGWTVIQRRGKFPVQQDFFLFWESYNNGFGNLIEEFWLGLENIRVLCLKGCKIRFDLQDQKGEKRFAVYQKFNLSSNYAIDISGYSGNAGDAMQYHNNYQFITKDRGETRFAMDYQSGWWHGSLYHSNLNGIYQPGKNTPQSVYWYEFHRNYENLASVEMKVIPN